VKVQFAMPLRLVPQVNAREHWRKVNARAQVQKITTWAIGTAALRRLPSVMAPPFRVRIVRVGPKRMDDDNAIGSAKAVRDTIAKILGVDDGDRKVIRFTYGQAIGPFGCEVTISGQS
jgi:hypothetical protein